LPSGIYNVNFRLRRQNEETEWNELLYIYSALTSSFSIEFENDVFHRTHYNVTIVFNDGMTPNGLQSVLHAGTLTRPSPDPSRTGYIFMNWYSDAALTTLYNFNAIVIDDTTMIYARWGTVSLNNGTTTTGFANLTDAFDAIGTQTGSFTVTLYADQDQAPHTLATANQNITLVGNATEREIRLSQNGTLFTITAGSLTLGNRITLVGRTDGENDAIEDNDETLVLVQNAATELIMLNGSKITGNTSTHAGAQGSAVTLAAGAIFTMNGGEITNNCGAWGGIYFNGASFTVGGTAVINRNTLSDNTTVRNVILLNNRYITFGTGGNTPAAGMNIGITKIGNNGVFVQSAQSTTYVSSFLAYVPFFFADDVDNSVNIVHNVVQSQSSVNSSSIRYTEYLIVTYLGTSRNPFEIHNETDLRRVGTEQSTQYNVWSLSESYILMADIELDAGNLNNWTPIGTFSGSFNGNNYRIINLSINNTALGSAGLFSAFSAGVLVQKLGLENVNINAGTNVDSSVGGIVGTMSHASINNCYVTGTIRGGLNVGGIAGSSDSNGRVTNCYTTASIEGTRIGLSNNLHGVAGIVGNSYFMWANGTTVGGYLSNCAVLSQRITGLLNQNNGGGPRRVGGRSGLATQLGNNNVAFAYMLNRVGNTDWPRKGLTDLSGADIFAWQIYVDPTIGGRFTAANGWTLVPGKLPGFGGVPVEWPSWLIDAPVITLNFTMVNGAPPIADVTLYRTNQSIPDRPGTATFTIDNPGDFQSIEWWLNNTDLTESDPSALTIDALDYSAGNRDLTLEVITNGGVPFSRVITVRIIQ